MGIARLKQKQNRGELGGGKSTILSLKENESAIISIVEDANKEIIDSLIHHKVHSADNTNTWPDKTIPCFLEFGETFCPLCQMEKIVKHKQFVKSQTKCVIQFINFDAEKESKEKIIAIQRLSLWEGYYAGFLDTYEVELKDYIDENIDVKLLDNINAIITDTDLTALEQYTKLEAIIGGEHANHLINPFHGLKFRVKMSGKLPNAQYTWAKMKSQEVDTILEANKGNLIVLHDFWRKPSISSVEEITGVNFSDYMDMDALKSYEADSGQAYE